MHGGKHHHPHNGRPHEHQHDHAGPGHNHAHPSGRTAQWQVPHLPDGANTKSDERDLDLVERAFLEGFAAASDPTSFLRLAHVRFEGAAPDGRRLVLLRVETDAVTDVGSVTPHVGGASFRYDVLAGRMVSRRARLQFIYFDGDHLRSLSLAEAGCLAEP
jgi:hypothetical protein